MDRRSMLFEKFQDRWSADLNFITTPKDDPFKYSLRRISESQENESSIDDKYCGEVDSLRIRYIGRWGNYVISLTNVFHLAEKMGAKRVYLIPTGIFALSAPSTINGIQILSTHATAPAGSYEMEGQFFFSDSLGPLLSDLTPERRAHIAATYVRPLMSLRSDGLKLAEDDLLIHIRSGDIFLGPDGLGGTGLGGALYTQPPLGFYELAAGAFFKGKTGRVVIVAENCLNPIIFPLVEALELAGHAVVLRLNHGFNEDLGLLMDASNIVFAAGTIAVAVAMMSENLRDAYFFRHNSTGTYHPLETYLPSSLRCHIALDNRLERYIAVGDWKNTAQQRREMVHFSRNNISWEDDSFAAPFNAALGKRTTQSSAYTGTSLSDSAKAVNGRRTGTFAFHTDYEVCPWWEIDFGEALEVKSIVIHNRPDHSERAKCLAIFGRDGETPWLMVHNQHGEDFGSTADGPLVVEVGGKQLRFIRIQLLDANYLHLDQVEVWV